MGEHQLRGAERDGELVTKFRRPGQDLATSGRSGETGLGAEVRQVGQRNDSPNRRGRAHGAKLGLGRRHERRVTREEGG